MTTQDYDTVPASLELAVGRPPYRYYVAWTVSGDIALEVDMSGVSWSRVVRRAGTFSGTIGFNDDLELEDAYWGTMPGKMSVYVTRYDKPVWGGVIESRTYDAAARTLQIEAASFESMLYRRNIWHTLVYENTVDQYEVVRSLITIMQTDFEGIATEADRAIPHPEAADLGITVSPAYSGHTQDRQVFEGNQMQSFGEIIEAFSNNQNGFEYNINVDWDLAHDKFTKELVFREAPPSQMKLGVEYTGPRPGLEENYFEFPGNIMTVNYSDTISDTGTRWWVTGAESDAGVLARGVWENEPFLSTRWPMFDAIESSEHSGASLLSTLDSYAESYGGRLHPPIPTWDVTIVGTLGTQPDALVPGDWCRLLINDPFLRRSAELDVAPGIEIFTKRIGQFTVTVPDTTQLPETVTLSLIDEWNDAEGG